MKNFTNIEEIGFDPNDPNPWMALYLDQSVPLRTEVKEVWLRDCSSKSRQFLLPFVRPLARLLIILIQVLKIFIPRRFSAPLLLHRLIVIGLKTFVSPEANWLILRHFHVGSETLAFIEKNIAEVDVPLSPLRPKNLDDLRDNLFVKHDINLFNFVIRLNQQLQDKNMDIPKRDQLDLSMVTVEPYDIDPMPNGWFNFIDLETAIEIFTPIYQLFLSDNDFWRATNSLQLDETIGIYVAKILGQSDHLVLVNNGHPLAQMITLTSGWRLVLHGLSSEFLHGWLVEQKTNAKP